MIDGGINQTVDNVLSEVAGAVIDSCVVRELRSPAAAENVSPGPGDGIPEVAATKRPGVAAVENDDDISGARRVRELVNPGTADRGGEQIRGFGVLHAQVQSTVQIELAVPTEVEKQDIVSLCSSEELAQRAHCSVDGCLGQKRYVHIVEQAGLLVDESAVSTAMSLTGPLSCWRLCSSAG